MSRSEFSADWLQLRAAADARARAADLLAALGVAAAGADGGQPRRFAPILDLGAGTGANLRYLAPRLGPAQHWRCIDQNADLLSQLPSSSLAWSRRAGYRVDIDADTLSLAGPGWSASVSCEQRDLARALDLPAPSAGASEPSCPPLSLPAGALITASALLDLVAEDWLARLIERCRSAGCALLFALSYDGRVTLTPAQPVDLEVIELVNQHQRRDKGFGPALGPTAPAVAERLLAGAGYRLRSAHSDWQIGADEPELLMALIAGWIEAALELEPAASSRLQGWQQARQAQIARGDLRVQVGHRDIIALPPV